MVSLSSGSPGQLPLLPAALKGFVGAWVAKLGRRRRGLGTVKGLPGPDQFLPQYKPKQSSLNQIADHCLREDFRCFLCLTHTHTHTHTICAGPISLLGFFLTLELTSCVWTLRPGVYPRDFNGCWSCSAACLIHCGGEFLFFWMWDSRLRCVMWYSISLG